MKLLFDQNLSFRLCNILARVFPDSEHVGRLGLGEADDLAIWRHAGKNGFVLVSHDSDFGELAILHGPPPKVIWLRCGNRPTAFIAERLRLHSGEALAFARDDSKVCYEIY